MLFGKKRVIWIVFFFLLILPLNAYALNYVANIQISVEKSLYGPGEEVHVSGTLALSNQSANDTSFQPVASASINFTIENASGVQRQAFFNTTSDGKFRSRSDVYTTGIQILAPSGDGYYNLTTIYTDPDSVQWKTGGAIKVYTEALDIISISPAKASYYSGDNVSITLKALREAGDGKVALANITINGSMRYNNRTLISTFSCRTGGDGACITSAIAPTTAGTYLLEANNFLSTSSFKVVLFDAYVYTKDSTGESFKEIFSSNEAATVEVRVALNGSAPTGDFVFNGTITDASNNVITNITSTNLNSNNSYTNRFSFTISTKYPSGTYYVHVTAFKTGDGSAGATTSFQVRSWTLMVVKAAQDSGFEYEYTAFQSKNVSFEIYVKERENGTIIPSINSSQFNITLGGKTGDVLATGNASWNASCSSGCYQFTLTTPAAAGSYKLSTRLNYSSDVQTVHRIIGVTTTSLSAVPSNSEGQLKELFGTTEFVYISLSAKNETSAVNVSDVVIESVIYENGTKYSFTEVASWDNVNSTNNAFEWALNSSAQRLKLDAPKAGGNYLLNVFINNRSAAASTKFGINPYSVCGSAKSTAGTVDSSSSFYVWQYKTADTVYLELKIMQAQNPLGRAKAAANDSTFSSSYYGMGSACYIDTTKNQVITNATITVESVVNLQTAATASLNTSATYCSADDNQGAYTCTIKPTTKWDGGRYKANLKMVGSDGETSDRAESVFEARAFYLWAWTASWTNKPASNITFSIQMYEAGTNWWGNLGSSGGINGDVTIEKIEYNGKDGEWLWPPINIGYNITGLNTSNITSGRGTLTLTTDRLSKRRWEPGYYVMTIKGTNDATGESDYGQAWFGIRQWETYSTPIEQVGNYYRYKNSFGVKENVSLYIRITNAGDWNDNGGASLGGTVTVGVKKLQFYTSWPPTDLNSSAYTVNRVNVSASSPWYSSASTTTYAGYVMNISPAKGRWDGGYYNVILDVNGTETGYGWFSAKAFHVDTQPTNAGGTYTYTTKGTGAAYFNISTTKNEKSYGYYGANDYINTTIKDVALKTWNEVTWEQVELKYPNDLNVSPLMVNGTTLVMVNKSGNWQSGYYWGEVTLQDSENSTGTGYMWFSVRPFRVDTTVNPYTIDATGNASVTLTIRQPDWSNNNIIYGNYTVTQIYEDVWSSGTRTKTGYTNYAPSVNSSFNGTTVLNITPSTSWSTNNNGYHYLSLVVKDNSDNSTQNGWVSFRAVPFAVSIGAVPNAYSFPQGNNVTVQVSVTKAISGGTTSANLSRAFKWTWPTQTEYGFAVGSCTSAASGTCLVNGTQNITIIVPSDGWGSDWHYIYLDFVSVNGANKIQADNSVWFKSIQPYEGYFSNYDASYTNWKYYFGFTENLTITLYARNSNYQPQDVNITKVEVSEDGDNCWSESCKTYTSHSYAINGSSSNEISGNATIIIINNGSQWRRGQHSIRATVSGSAGTGVIRTGYVWVKDTSAPGVLIISPAIGEVVNSSTVIVNVTANEAVRCSMLIMNYDIYSTSYCSGGNVTNGACNSTRFNGSTYHWQSVGSYSNAVSNVHTYTLSTSSWVNQDYGMMAYCEDVDYNYVQNQTAFTLNRTVANTPIGVNLTSPANNTAINTSTATFSYNVTGTANAIANCSIYMNMSGWSINKTNLVSLLSTSNNAANTTTLAGLNNGTYLWNTYCELTTNTTNFGWGKNFTLTVAIRNSTSSNINVTLISPADGSTVNSSTVNYNYTFTGAATADCTFYTNTTGTWKSNFTINSVTSGTTPFNNTNISNGNYLWNVYCINSTDATKTAWGANWTFNINNNLSNTTTSLVGVNLTSPANNGQVNTSLATFLYNVSGPSNVAMNCTIHTNTSGNWTANTSDATIVTPGNAVNNSNSSLRRNISITGLNIGAHIWNMYCHQIANTSNSAWGDSNWTINVINNATTTTQVTVNLSSPANNTAINTSTATFAYNISGTGSTIANCSLYINASNNVFTVNKTMNNFIGTTNTTQNSTNVTGFNNGAYLWNIYCSQATNTSNYAWAPANWTFTRNSS